MTSIDYNSMVNKAINEAYARKQNSASNSARLLTNDPNHNIAKTLEASGRGTELSMEQIADAMKSRQAKEKQEEDFLLQHSARIQQEKQKRDIEITAEIGRNVQSKISEIQINTELALDRQSNIARSLKGYQKNPFIK